MGTGIEDPATGEDVSRGNPWGIWLRESRDNMVSGNEVDRSHAIGIGLNFFSERNIIDSNTVTENGPGAAAAASIPDSLPATPLALSRLGVQLPVSAPTARAAGRHPPAGA